MLMTLATKSLLHRKGSVILTLIAMTISIIVLLGVEHIRQQSKQSFASTVSGVDLIVGARTSSLNLLLYSVFRLGSPTNNISWQAYEQIKTDKNIQWQVPISLGDSHRGYRVLGTTPDYFKHFKYGQKHLLELAQGEAFSRVLDVVLGAKVAAKLNYKVGDNLVLAHGIAATSFKQHDQLPFNVTGILAPTGTPVDQTLHVSLAGLEAIHTPKHHAAKLFANLPLNQAPDSLKPTNITAIMVGLKSRLAAFNVQRKINQYQGEPLKAILPGIALAELWQMMATAENALGLIAILVLLSALAGLSAILLTSIRERSAEIKLLRVMGASNYFILLLVQLEALLISLLSIALAVLLLNLILFFGNDWLVTEFGLYISGNIFSLNSVGIMAIVLIATLLAALIPTIKTR